MRILWDNEVDKYAPLFSSQNANFPAENVKHIHLSSPWRTIGVTGQYYTIDAGEGKTITADCAVIVGKTPDYSHNLTEPVNLIDRPDCESTTPPMIQSETVPYTTGVTYARSSDFARNGTYSFKMTKTAVGFTDAYASIFDSDLDTDDLHGLVPGGAYRFTQWYYSPASGGAGAGNYRWTFQDYDGGWGNTQGWAGSGPDDTWLLADLTFNVRPGATGVRFEMYFMGLAGQTEFIYLDDFDLNAGATAKIQAEPTNTWTSPDLDEAFSWNADSMIVFFTQKTKRFWRFYLDDAANPDGYLNIPRLVLGKFLQMPGVEPDFDLPRATSSRRSISPSGQGYGDKGNLYLAPAFSFQFLDQDEHEALDGMWAGVENIKPVVLVIWEGSLDIQGPIYCWIDQDSLGWKKSDSPGLYWALQINFLEAF